MITIDIRPASSLRALNLESVLNPLSGLGAESGRPQAATVGTWRKHVRPSVLGTTRSATGHDSTVHNSIAASAAVSGYATAATADARFMATATDARFMATAKQAAAPPREVLR